VGADALLQAVVDGPQVDDLFHVPPAAFHLPELLEAESDVLGAEARVAAAQQVLAVQLALGLDLGGVDAQQPCTASKRTHDGAGLRLDGHCACRKYHPCWSSGLSGLLLHAPGFGS
jgi:hypothetical protein